MENQGLKIELKSCDAVDPERKKEILFEVFDILLCPREEMSEERQANQKENKISNYKGCSSVSESANQPRDLQGE